MSEVVIHEVGPRDGLQAEKQLVPTEQKINWIQDLLASGIDILQIGSFVHPEKVPQMADTDQLFKHFTQAERKPANVMLAGLVLNEKGLERGLACGVELFCMGVSASETYSRKNTGMSTEEALSRIVAIAKRAVAAGKKVQVSVQNAFGCSYEGAIAEEKVLKIVRSYLEADLRLLSLADTAGMAYPQQVQKLFAAVLNLGANLECACHFHETYGLGLLNCYAALQAGVRYFESSFAGLGGSPFAAVTSGNVCTEDFVHSLQLVGRRRDIKLDKIIQVSKEASLFFQRVLPGIVHKTSPHPLLTARTDN